MRWFEVSPAQGDSGGPTPIACAAVPLVNFHLLHGFLLLAFVAHLAPENFHVARDLRKVKSGKPLSPVLLVRGQLANGVALTIADGYHRVCASYHLDEDADIPCRIADLAKS